MGADGHEVGELGRETQIHKRCRGDGVRVQQRTPGDHSLGNAAQGGQGLHDAGLVVRSHHRHDGGLAVNKGESFINLRHATVLAAHDAKFDAGIITHHALGGARDGVMLDGTNDDVGAVVFAKKRPGGARNGEMSGLGSTTGENDFVNLASDEGGHLVTRFFYRLSRAPSRVVRPRGISDDTVRPRCHGLGYLGAARRGGGVVEVEGLAHAT